MGEGSMKLAPGDSVRARYFTKKTWLFTTTQRERDPEGRWIGAFQRGMVIAVVPMHNNPEGTDTAIMVIDDVSQQFGWTYLGELSKLSSEGMVYFR